MSTSTTEDDFVIPYYNMQKKCIAFIFHHYELRDPKIPERNEYGSITWLKICLNRLNFSVNYFENLEFNDVMDVMKGVSTDFSSENLSCLMVFVLKYRNPELLQASNQAYKVEKLWEELIPPKCYKFVGVPKLFFSDASIVELFDADQYAGPHELAYPANPDLSEILHMSSMCYGFKSIGLRYTESSFIRTLCEVFDIHANKYDLIKLLTIISHELKEAGPLIWPEYISTLRKLLKFNSKVPPGMYPYTCTYGSESLSRKSSSASISTVVSSSTSSESNDYWTYTQSWTTMRGYNERIQFTAAMGTKSKTKKLLIWSHKRKTTHQTLEVGYETSYLKETADAERYPFQRINYYDVEKPGMALIFNHYKFSDPTLTERNGTNKDVERLEKCLYNLNFIVRCYDDYCLEEIKTVLQEVSKNWSSQNISCLMVIVLTHGKSGYLYAYDKKYTVRDLKEDLVPPKCDKFVGIPKLFIIQACRNLGDPSSSPEPKIRMVPNPCDIYECYATYEGFKAYRLSNIGSLFIQKMCDVFEKEAKAYELPTLLIIIRNEIAKKTEELNITQHPEDRSTLKRCFKFNTNVKEIGIGINLGTQNSCVAVFDAAKSTDDDISVCNDDSDKKHLPSLVLFNDDRYYTGNLLQEMMGIQDHDLIFSVIQPMASNIVEHVKEQCKTRWPVTIKDKNGRVEIQLLIRDQEKLIYSDEISTKLMITLKRVAENYLKLPIGYAVISVPVYFNEYQTNLVEKICRRVGLSVLDIISKPHASILNFRSGKYSNKMEQNIVYNLNSTTFDVSVIQRDGKKWNVLASDWHNNLGEENLTDILFNYYVDQFEKHNNIKLNLDEDKILSKRIKSSCEDAKIDLLSSKMARINVDSISFSCSITRDEFQSMNELFFKKTIDLVKNCIIKAKLAPKKITKIILLGKSTNFLLIKKLFKENFPKAHIREIDDSNLSAAKGAAIYSEMLLNGVNEASTSGLCKLFAWKPKLCI